MISRVNMNETTRWLTNELHKDFFRFLYFIIYKRILSLGIYLKNDVSYLCVFDMHVPTLYCYFIPISWVNFPVNKKSVLPFINYFTLKIGVLCFFQLYDLISMVNRLTKYFYFLQQVDKKGVIKKWNIISELFLGCELNRELRRWLIWWKLTFRTFSPHQNHK